MTSGMDDSVWKILLFVLGAPVLTVFILNIILRKRGGLGAGWGAALTVFLAGIAALLVILDKVRL